MEQRLKDRVAVVIGATGGIGKAVVERFVAEGAIVVATGSSGRQDAMTGDRVHGFACDLTDPDAPQRVADYCRSTFGRTDILVNNAGISVGSRKLHETSLEDWDRLMAVNLRGVFLGMKAFIPMMLAAKSGAIINMGSTSAYRATPGIGGYGASKAGIIQLTQVAALDYAKDGIRVNAVCPGTVQSPMLDSQSPERLVSLLARIPLGRFAAVQDVAAMTAFLASDDASYITGQGYLVDGGRFAGG